MSVTRFTIHKDAHEYLTKEKDVAPKRAICKHDQFGFDYSGDADFKKYFRGNFQKVEEISKFYTSPELFLQNIHWESIFANVESALTDILKKAVSEQKEEPALVIVNSHPFEMVIMGQVLLALGYKNTAFNFNRNPSVNGLAKTFEAYLLLAAWNNSPYFQEQSKGIEKKINALSLKLQPEKTFFLFDENNAFVAYEYRQIDTYLKTQIGYRELKNVYRLDKYPTVDFLLAKGIKKVIAFDNDSDLGWMVESYRDTIKASKKGIDFSNATYVLATPTNPGLFEDYLLVKNKEYMVYRQGIEEKTLASFPGLAEKKLEQESVASIHPIPENARTVGAMQKQDRSIVPYLVLFPVIFLAFLIADLGAFHSKTGTNGTGSTSTGTSRSNNFFYWGWGGGSSWSSGGGGSSTISSPSTSSSIKSFGGGGFSKGGGG